MLFLCPLPQGVRGRIRTATFRRKSRVWGRFRPGSGGKFIVHFYFGPKRSWVSPWHSRRKEDVSRRRPRGGCLEEADLKEATLQAQVC